MAHIGSKCISCNHMLPTTKRATPKSSLPENCRVSQKTRIYKESLDACQYILSAVRVLFEKKTEHCSFGCPDFLSASTGQLVKLNQTFWATVPEATWTRGSDIFCQTTWNQMTKKKRQLCARQPKSTARLHSRRFLLLLSKHKVITLSHKWTMPTVQTVQRHKINLIQSRLTF